jgi:hypothetical protein
VCHPNTRLNIDYPQERHTAMLSRTGAIVLLAVLGVALPASSAQADPNPCPGGESGFVLWDVAAVPYGADNFVDAAGNANGWVCARELPRTFVQGGVEYPLQNFIDDRV